MNKILDDIRYRLRQIIQNKKVLILGFGREGQTTYELLRRFFPDMLLTISDEQKDFQRQPEHKHLIKDRYLTIVSGERYLENIGRFELIFKTPGVPIHKIAAKVPHKNITSQTDIFIKLFHRQIIGITGTKGKSTTTSLIYHILSSYTKNVILVGNIGIPPFSLVDKIDNETVIVYELSCHQLGNVSASPHISVMLNLYPEHLDYYPTFEDYMMAKFNITRYQHQGDIFVFNSDSDKIVELLRKYYKSLLYYSYSLKNDTDSGCILRNGKIIYNADGEFEEVFNTNSTYNLTGEHNLLNIMPAIIVCRQLDIPVKVISDGIKTYKPLPHRLEAVGKYDKILFYNDSISTIPESTIAALKALENVDTLILGGFDRGLDYKQLFKHLTCSGVRNLIFLDKAGERMLEEINGKNSNKKGTSPKLGTRHVAFFKAKDMNEAVKLAKSNTAAGKICLLSPAAASYGMFKDFEDRGNTFVKLVKGK